MKRQSKEGGGEDKKEGRMEDGKKEVKGEGERGIQICRA